MDKKIHKPHRDDESHQANLFKKTKQREFEEEDLGFDSDEDDLYYEVQKFLK